jgi:hypothetical protein
MAAYQYQSLESGKAYRLTKWHQASIKRPLGSTVVAEVVGDKGDESTAQESEK